MHTNPRFIRHDFGAAEPSGKRLAAGLLLRAAQRLALGVLGLAIGSLVLYVTFYVAYGIIWFGYNYGVSAVSELLFSKPLRLAHGLILLTCWIFIALLFVENQWVHRSHFTSPRRPSGFCAFIWYAGAAAAAASLLMNASASAHAITNILLLGPRLVTWSLGAVWDSFGLLRGYLFHQTRRRPAAPAQEPQFRPAADSWVAPSQEELTCYAALGITPPTSLEEIKTAYRRTIKLWHPDRHRGRSEAFRQAAEEKAKAVNTAYAFLLDIYSRRAERLHETDAAEGNP